jgi:hypothetical protein
MGLEDHARVQTKGARPLTLSGINGFLSISQTRNNSGAFLLTIRSLTSRRGNAPFTIVA